MTSDNLKNVIRQFVERVLPACKPRDVFIPIHSLVRFGPNLIHADRKQALLLQFLAKFRNPLVIILMIASALSAFTGDAASLLTVGWVKQWFFRHYAAEQNGSVSVT